MQAQKNVLFRKTIRDIHRSLVKKETSVTKLCNESSRIIDETSNLNAFITVCKDDVIHEAKQYDENLSTKIQSPLFGIPISVKDNFCTNNVLTTCGSRMLHNFIPPYTATVVSKLTDSGCIMMGKTNMDEFAMGSSSTTSYYGSAANYHKMDLLAGMQPGEENSSKWFMAGGSSTGSAISVASGACFASIGTDTGGSTRQPASLTGVVGFKPTYGLISRFGLVPLVHSLDVVSILTNNVEDANLIFDAIIGQDENDLTTVDHEQVLENKLNLSDDKKTRIRVGVPEKFILQGGNVSSDVSEQFNRVLKSLSNSENNQDVAFELVNFELPHSKLASECYTIISSAEIASNMSCYDGVKYGFSVQRDNESNKFDKDEFFRENRDQGFGAEVKKRILLGNFFMLEENRDKYLMQALRLRRLIHDEFCKVFSENQIDVIITPSTPTTSLTHDDWLKKQSDNRLFYEDYFLIPSNLANLPSISLPCGFSKEGLPFGLQLISRKYTDLDLLKISQLFENKVIAQL